MPRKKDDEGQIVITGSHGGLIGGRPEKAFNVNALLTVFNDAGIDEAGVDSLKPLDKRNIAAVIVAHTSAVSVIPVQLIRMALSPVST